MFPRAAFVIAVLLLPFGVAVLEKNGSENDWSSMPNDQGFADSDDDIRMGCIDWQGKLVADGEIYVPNGNDMCMRCTCDKHFPIMCHSVACSPPLNCASPQLVKGACCEYVCLDDGSPKDSNVTDGGNSHEKDDGESITNLSLRLIASTVTSFLVLALLLFMVHRLRQRRLLLAMRRFEARAREGRAEDTDSEPYIPDAFMSLECPPYTDPPPPYSPPKPPQILPGEQPPPYDEINHSCDTAMNSADENRNEVQGGDGGSVASNPGQGAQAASATQTRDSCVWRGVNMRNGPAIDNGGIQQSNLQRRSYEQAGNGSMRPCTTLSAYASTDVVEGLGVVISPGSDVVSYGAGWSTWQNVGHEEERRGGSRGAVNHRRALSSGDQPCSTNRPSSSRVQTLPTTTAFQRFSNIFKRESWRAKQRPRHSRPASHYSTPTYYATVPRSELGACTGDGNIHSQGVEHSPAKNSAPGYGRRFPGRMCMSYDSSQAAYTLGAISPSTSSSTSTNSTEQYDQHHTSNTTNTSTSSNCASVSPPVGSCSVLGDSFTSSTHRQQFCDDLRRHLPPLQNPDSPESAKVGPDTDNGGICAPQSQCPVAENCSEWAQSSLPLNHTAAPEQSMSHIIPEFEDNSMREGNINRLRPQTSPQNFVPMQSSPLPPTSCQHNVSGNQQSLASFIMSHPTPLMSGIPEQTLDGERTSSHPSCESNGPLHTSHLLSDLSSVTSSQLNSSPPNQGRATDNLGAASQNHSLPSSQNVVSSTTSRPSPSPSPPASRNSGAMRRSQSGASQASMFSVCSETGEKKLRANDSLDEDTKVLTADSQYPEYHSLPKSRPLLAIANAPGVCAVKPCAESQSLRLENPSGWQEDIASSEEDIRHAFTDPVNPASSSTVRSASANQNNFPAQTICDSSMTLSDSVFQPERGDGGDSTYNFNTAVVDKTVPSKDLPSGDSGRMTQSVNIPPLPPFVTAQSGKLIPAPGLKHSLSAVAAADQSASIARTGKTSEMGKKHKKKKTKDKNSSGVQISKSNKFHHPSSSPKRAFPSITESNRERNQPQKSEGLSKDSEGTSPRLRAGDKKHKFQNGPKRQPVRLSDPSSCNNIMTRSADDAHTLYGNADVYRGVRGDGLGASVTMPHHPLQYPGLWRQPDHHDKYDSHMDKGTALNDLNQPPSYLKSQAMETSAAYFQSNPDAKQDQNLQAKKRGGHRKQVSVNEKMGHVPSPVRHKSRPRSLAVPDSYPHEKCGDPPPVRPTVTAGDNGPIGKGARSGFGRDLNFDDQAGLADFHIQDIDFTTKKYSHNQDSHHQPVYSLPSRKISDSGNLTVNMAKVGASPGGGHSGSKSGLSHDLSFTYRPPLTSGHIKKRQSLPAVVNALSPPGAQERSSGNGVAGGARSRISEESQLHVGQVRGERSTNPSDRRHDRPAICDDYIEATSYV